MIRFAFGVEDAARIRFALSPMLEVVSALRVLRDPGQAGMHLTWVRDALPVARRLPLATVFALVPPAGPMPDFLTPPPSGGVVSFADELERVRRTPPEQVRAEILTTVADARRSRRIAEVLDDPAAALPGIADALERFWDEAFAQAWPRVRALLEADVAHRAGRLVAAGAVGLFGDLHPSVAWRGDGVEVEIYWTQDVTLDGRGLLLVPSAMQWQRTACLIDPPHQPTLVYPARGLALLWQAPSRVEGGLDRVLGRTRTRLLHALDAPRATTELAAALGLSAGGVSAHLSALREAGLLTSTRHGHRVLYARTSLADQLL